MHPDLTTLPLHIERQCEKCGKSYMVARADYVRGRRRFCSTECWYGPKVERICEQCGKAFSVSPCVVERDGGKYCGRECYRAAMNRGAETERTCTRCGETNPIEEFQKRGAYRLTFCNTCLAAERRDRYATDPEHAEKYRQHARLVRHEHPEMRGAWQAVKLAVKAGKLIPQPCWCGNPVTDAHHHRGYAHQHWLDVVWLCRRHHSELHHREADQDAPA